MMNTPPIGIILFLLIALSLGELSTREVPFLDLSLFHESFKLGRHYTRTEFILLLIASKFDYFIKRGVAIFREKKTTMLDF